MATTDGDARVRLQQAALQLFKERGYELTTAAQIATRAGVTERTFFRHFRDKREVLFDGESRLRAALVASIADAPARPDALGLLFGAFQSVVPMLEDNRPFAKPRHEVILREPALHEREVAKLNALADALAIALQTRGVPELRAALASRAGMAAFAHATTAWLKNPKVRLAARIENARRELTALLVEADGQRR